MIWESPSPFVLFKLFLNKKIVDCSGIRSRIVGVEGMHSDHLTITPTQVNNFRASVLVLPFVTGFFIFFRTDPEMSGCDDFEVPSDPIPPQKVATVEFKLVEDLRLVTIPVTSCLLVLMSYVFLGTVLFASWEGWNYLDGAYFCFISLMTIGFGDFVPGNKYIYQVTDNISERVRDLCNKIGRFSTYHT